MRFVRFEVISIVLLLLAIAAGCGSSDNGSGPDKINSNLVWVDRVSAYSNQSDVKVNVWFGNLVPLAGVEVPLKVSGGGFSIDSVSFIGSRVDGFFLLAGEVDGIEHTIDIAATDTTAYIDSGNGLLASIYFSLYESSGGTVITIDTFSVDLGSDNYPFYVDTSAAANKIIPDFSDGSISVVKVGG